MSNVIELYTGDKRLESLHLAIIALIYERGDGLPLPAVIGVIRLVELDILADAKET